MPSGGNGYYTARRSGLLRDFDRAARRVDPLLATRYGVEVAVELVAQVRNEFDLLIPVIPYLGGKQPFTQFVIATAWFLAIYRVLGRRGERPEAVGRLLFGMSEAFLQAYPAYLRRLFGRMTFSRRRLKRLRKGAERSHRKEYPYDYVYDFVEESGQDFDYGVDYRECASLKFLRSHGAEEITQYLCAVDVIYSEALGWGLRRTMTLAEGRDRCDFRFKKGGVTQVALPPGVRQALLGGSEPASAFLRRVV